MVIALFRHDLGGFSETEHFMLVVCYPDYKHIVDITIRYEAEGAVAYHEQLLVHVTAHLTL
jgi:hypothetical protein